VNPIPDAAIDAAMSALDAWRADPDKPWTAQPVVEQLLKAAAPVIAAAERERIYAELGNNHYVIFTEDRWTIEHSVECRLSGRMHECYHHVAVARIATEFDPAMAGRWLITAIDLNGEPALVRDDLLKDPP